MPLTGACTTKIHSYSTPPERECRINIVCARIQCNHLISLAFLVPVGLCWAQIPLSALAKTSRGLFPTMFLRHFAGSPCCTNFCLERTARAGGFVRSTNPPVGTRKNFPRLFFAFRGCATLSSLPLRLSIKSHKYSSCRWVCAKHKSPCRHSQKLTAAFLCISRLRRIFRRAPPLLRERK